jgi:hypothetical protein
MSSPAIAAPLPDIYSRQLPCPVIDAACPVVCVAEDVLAEGEVEFLLSTRADTSLFNRWQRLGYEVFCRGSLGRYLPEGWEIPAIPPMDLAVFATFAEADENCQTSDDKIVVLPKGRAFRRDRRDPEIFCRPRDTKDKANAARYLQMRAKYAETARATVELLARSLHMWAGIHSDLSQIASRFEEVLARFEAVSPLPSPRKEGRRNRAGG